MKKLTLFLFTILSANIYSQKGFYLRPIMEHKWHVNPGHPYDVTTPQGYTVKVEPINFFTLKGFDIGLYLGYKTKNFFFETGWSQDGAIAGARLTATNYYPYANTFYNDQMGEEMGIAYNKYPFRMGIKLFGKDSVTAGKTMRWQGFIYGGIDYLKRPGYGVEAGNGHSFVVNTNGDILQYSSKVGSELTWSYSKTIGFMLKAYNKKGQNVIGFGAVYSQGKFQTSYNEMRFKNYDGTMYTSFVESKSSGLYLSISKDIYFEKIIRRIRK